MAIRERYTSLSALPLKDGSLWFPLTSDVAVWNAAFPNLNLSQEFTRMHLWLHANPTRRKTAKGIRKFVVNWLLRASSSHVVVPLPEHMKEQITEPSFPAEERAVTVAEIRNLQDRMK